MNPLDAILWAVAIGVGIIVLGLAIAMAIAIVEAVRHPRAKR